MPDDGDVKRLRFFEQGQVRRILRVEMLVDRGDLQSAQAKLVYVVFELFDGVFVVRVDRAPADEPVRVFATNPATSSWGTSIPQ